MKKISLFLIVIVLSSAFVFAAVDPSSSTSGSSLRNYGLDIQLGASDYLYQVPVPGGRQINGKMYGLQVSKYFSFGSYMSKFEASYDYGMMAYSDPAIGGTVSGVPDYDWEFRGLGGYDISLGDLGLLTPYCGLGYRIHVGGQAEFRWLYRTELDTCYFPFGIEYNKALDSESSLRFAFELDALISGKMFSNASYINPTYDDITNNEDNGNGYKVSIKYSKGSLGMELFTRYWYYGPSFMAALNSTNNWNEPANYTSEYGIKFSWTI